MGNQALGPRALSDLEGTTTFTAGEIRECYKTFQKEAGTKMYLSMNEFKAIYRRHFPDSDPDQFAEHVFRRFDKDGSREINFREFVTALSVQTKGTPSQRLQWAFDLYDTDGTGYIDRTELKAMVQSIQKLRDNLLHGQPRLSADQVVDYIMDKVDKNKDNKLSKQEFVQGALQSSTLGKLLLGTLTASSSPFLDRKNGK